MLVSKMIQIEFTDSNIRAVDAIYDIRKAAESASLNLYSRHDVQLQYPMITDNDKVVVELKIPKEIVSTFAVGNHLRGISTYLLKRCEGRYDKHLVGKRLLNYIEIPNPEVKIEKLSMADRLEAISAFSKLLERSDSEAIYQPHFAYIKGICEKRVLKENIEENSLVVRLIEPEFLALALTLLQL